MNVKKIVGTIRYWVWLSWPALPMAAATLVGLALGLVVVVYFFPFRSELGANFTALGVMFVIQALTFAWVVRASRIAAARAQAARYRELVEQLEERDPDV
jgi:drug/metabolite transporter superfamily protein YnfA